MIRELNRRLRGEHSKEQDGFTLVELIVAIFILGLVLSIVGGFYLASTRIVAQTQATTGGTASASNVMDEVSKVIRFGTDNPVAGSSTPAAAFLSATAESVTMYSYVDSYVSSTSTDIQPVVVQFSLNASRQVVEKRWLPTSTNNDYFIYPTFAALATTTPSYSRIIGGPLLTTPTTPTGSPALFTFISNAGATMTIPGTGFTAAQLSTIAAVTVTVRVQGYATSARPAIVLTNTVRLPNLGYTTEN